ncbi:MAG: 23S rRNA (uracil(1939)-C(5))-methyltransferase RlmD [Gammaproteobacteria bacterium]|nr:23S rRNA (uracil(1939)-C(5))-methyltransferase RlmD [Gammaproteobacteria bacterium]
MSRRKKLPLEAVETRIESLSHEGRGISHVNGKTVFVDGALAGENITFRYRRSCSKYAEGSMEELLADSSSDRVEARCRHASVCGGCSLQHLSPDAQIEHKQNVLLEQLLHIGGVEADSLLPPLKGELWGYRRKARLGVKHVLKKEKVLVGFREKYSSYIADIDSCEVLHPSVGGRLKELAALIFSLTIYNKVAQIEVAVDEQDTALIFRNLETPDDADLDKLSDFAEQHKVRIYLQAGGPDTVTPLAGETDIPLSYQLDDGEITIYYAPSDFTQVNLDINKRMVKQVLELLTLQPEDNVLDLFCGLGNFTLPVARRVAQVIGIEGADSLVKKAEYNAQVNNINNARFFMSDLFTLESEPAYLDFNYQKLLLDPPRSGAQQVVEKWRMENVEKIVYVSCNPATLSRDAGILVKERGFKLVSAGVMDMFPHTTHVESLAIFERR